jgi:hypothetical protein
MQTRSQTRLSNLQESNKSIDKGYLTESINEVEFEKNQHSNHTFLKFSIDNHNSMATNDQAFVKQTINILSNEETNELHELIDDWENWHSKLNSKNI